MYLWYFCDKTSKVSARFIFVCWVLALSEVKVCCNSQLLCIISLVLITYVCIVIFVWNGIRFVQVVHSFIGISTVCQLLDMILYRVNFYSTHTQSTVIYLTYSLNNIYLQPGNQFSRLPTLLLANLWIYFPGKLRAALIEEVWKAFLFRKKKVPFIRQAACTILWIKQDNK